MGRQSGTPDRRTRVARAALFIIWALVLATTLTACATPSMVVASPWVILYAAISTFVARLPQVSGSERVKIITSRVAAGLNRAAQWIRHMTWRERLKVLIVVPVAIVVVYAFNLILFIFIELPLIWPLALLSLAIERLKAAKRKHGAAASLLTGVGWLYGPLLWSGSHPAGSSVQRVNSRIERVAWKISETEIAVLHGRTAPRPRRGPAREGGEQAWGK